MLIQALTSNVVSDHNLVVSSSLWPFDSSSDGFLTILTTLFFHIQVWCVLPRGLFWFVIVSYFWIYSNLVVLLSTCLQWNRILTIVTFVVWGQHVLNVFFLLIPLCKWFPIDMNICMTLKHDISNTGIFSWRCVCGCKSMLKVRSCDIATSNCKASQ